MDGWCKIQQKERKCKTVWQYFRTTARKCNRKGLPTQDQWLDCQTHQFTVICVIIYIHYIDGKSYLDVISHHIQMSPSSTRTGVLTENKPNIPTTVSASVGHVCTTRLPHTSVCQLPLHLWLVLLLNHWTTPTMGITCLSPTRRFPLFKGQRHHSAYEESSAINAKTPALLPTCSRISYGQSMPIPKRP